MTQRLWAALAVLATAVTAPPPPLPSQVTTPLDSTLLAGFRWRNVGPANMGGRVSSVAGIPSPSKTFFIAGAAGGILKTTNSRPSVPPVFVNQGGISIGHLAIAPGDTTQVWAGPGRRDA